MGCRHFMPFHLREHLALIAVELMADYRVVVIGQECGSPDGHSRTNRYCKSKLIWKCGFPKPGIGEQTQGGAQKDFGLQGRGGCRAPRSCYSWKLQRKAEERLVFASAM